MLRFEILADGVLVGHSELESGDPPMGVATGRFHPLPEYAAIKSLVLETQPSLTGKAQHGSQPPFTLTAREINGPTIPAQGGVHIIDYSAELGVEGLMVDVLGIGYPLYEQLFPAHVAAYRTRFARRD